MKIEERRARKSVQLPAFERNCRCEMFSGRLTKRYKIPGTQEAGRYASLYQRVWDIVKGESLPPKHDTAR